MSRTIVEAFVDTTKTALSSNWLKDKDSVTLIPDSSSVYVIFQTSGSYLYGDQYVWNGSVYRKLSDNETVIVPSSGGGSDDPSPGGLSGTTNYEGLTNKPKIEGVTLIGNKTFEELNLASLTNEELERILT